MDYLLLNNSAIKNNGFGNRFNNLSAKNKFTNPSNIYLDDLGFSLVNTVHRNQHASSANPFMNMNGLNSQKTFNRSLNHIELNSLQKN